MFDRKWDFQKRTRRGSIFIIVDYEWLVDDVWTVTFLRRQRNMFFWNFFHSNCSVNKITFTSFRISVLNVFRRVDPSSSRPKLGLNSLWCNLVTVERGWVVLVVWRFFYKILRSPSKGHYDSPSTSDHPVRLGPREDVRRYTEEIFSCTIPEILLDKGILTL